VVGVTCTTHGKNYKFILKHLVPKIENARQLGRLRYRREDNIKIDLEDLARESADWIPLVQDRNQWRRLIGTVVTLPLP
jgi:hypothetical protein